MPLYPFECPEHGVVDLFFAMNDVPKIGDTHPCEICGKRAKRLVSTANIDADRIRISKALKLHPDEIKDGTAARIHPGAEFTKDGSMIIRSRREKLQRMRERSQYDKREWVEYE